MYLRLHLFFFFSGQKVCFADFKHPCYKMAYFHELSSRVSFQEARLACESEGGALLTLENEAEQKLIESMLQNLTKPGTGISDGDFWIGLWRSGEGQASGACPDLYQWSDGSGSQYRWVGSWRVEYAMENSKGQKEISVTWRGWQSRRGKITKITYKCSCCSIFAETGIRMNLPVEVKSAWWCIINQRPILASEAFTFTSGMMTGATWSTITSASMNQVESVVSWYSTFYAHLILGFIFKIHYLWLFCFSAMKIALLCSFSYHSVYWSTPYALEQTAWWIK